MKRIFSIPILFSKLIQPLTIITLTFSLASILLASVSVNAEIYRYKDANGKWAYTDKKPSSNTAKDVDTLEFKKTKQQPSKGEISYYHKNGELYLKAENRSFAPLEFEIKSDLFSKGKYRFELDAQSEKVIYREYSKAEENPRYSYRYVTGSSRTYPDRAFHYLPPVPGNKKFRVTQGFNGKFSHNHEPSLNAIDIAMPVGTTLRAARAGTVIATKDDYHMGGAKKYFLDKANYVDILHSDGTIATYAHILLGSLKVQPGDKVEQGQAIARSGTSGYSTGPHLHFVIRRNAGMKTVSLPFTFKEGHQAAYTPKRNMKVSGIMAEATQR